MAPDGEALAQAIAMLTGVMAAFGKPTSVQELAVGHAVHGWLSGWTYRLDLPSGSALETATDPLRYDGEVPGALKMVGYIRCSSSEQAASGLGLHAQEARIREGCDTHGWALEDVVADSAESGKSLDRPALLAALKRIADGSADGLVVAKLDRATRSVSDFAHLISWFEEAGATFVALDLGIDTSSPGGKLMAHVFASVAEWERDIIAARTKESLASLRSSGQRISRPAVADDPALANRILVLRSEGRTYQAIADLLNGEGVPTLRGGSQWRVSAVQAAAGYKRPPARKAGTKLPTIKRRRQRRPQP